MHRTHTCGELRGEHVDETVTLAGWVKTVRHHGKFFFIDLEDRYGATQLIASESFEDLEDVSRESVLKVTGTVQEKPEPNEELATGDVEVSVESYELIGEAQPLPLSEEATMQTRLQYRYLDIRNNAEKLVFRHNFSQAIREYLDAESFVEVETPLLVKATPEGARDYVVPSRVHNGSAYALPQSPQLYKQLLMVGGLDKYYQFARCLRDEDLRADRQPEFTQIDMEMSFVEEEDVLQTTEEMVREAVKETQGEDPGAFPRIKFHDAMRRYGSDKPDTRFGNELQDITVTAHESDFNIFKNADYVGAVTINETLSRSDLERYESLAREVGAKGMAWLQHADTIKGPITKFVDTEEFLDVLGLTEGSTALIIAGDALKSQEILGHLRLRLRDDFDLADPDQHNFVWVTDFPLFEWDEDRERWMPAHHVFTMPAEEHVESFREDPANALSQSYDLALNGVELGSGSIRVTDPDLQRDLLDFIGVGPEEAQKKFGFLLEAYEYGAPVHGGIALGLDRIIALLTGKNDIREVMAFPKNKKAESPMDGSPSALSAEVLEELGLEIRDE